MFCMRNEANKFGNLVELFSKLKYKFRRNSIREDFHKKSLRFEM